MLFFSLYYKYPVNKDSAIWAEFLHSFQLTFMNIKVLNGMSLISWFGSRSNEINILIFPVQTTPRPTYQTVCLPSSQVSQRYPKFSMFKTEPGPSSSILCHSKGLVHTVMQARNLDQNIIFLRAGTWPVLFSALSLKPRTVHGTE